MLESVMRIYLSISYAQFTLCEFLGVCVIKLDNIRTERGERERAKTFTYSLLIAYA